ncbi:MAG: TlpA disulfide reductase family protein [Bacteroides sp.]|nr:TlpA disulfide reductase family protein [Bacteroides sp.]
MKRNIVKIILFAGLAVTACKPVKQTELNSGSNFRETLIEGVLEEGENSIVILEEMAVREYIPIDTVSCDARGHFQISFKQAQTAFYVLRAGGIGYITLVIEPGQKITLNGSYQQPDRYSVKGSEGSEALMELSAEHKRTLNELGDVVSQIRESQELKNYPEIKMKLDLKFDSITRSFKAYSGDFINRNQESLAILIALYNLYGQGLPVFDPIEDFQSYLLVDSLLQSHYPEFEAAQMLHTQVLEASATKQETEKDHRPAVGEIAPDFVSSRPDGSQLALSDLRGDYILLSFWAGWSSLSREENQYLSEIWENMASFPFKILQVSFDGERESWTSAIDEDELTWYHVSDLLRWESAIADLYAVEKIPSNYLIDPEGKIIARDLFGSELLELIKNLYSN